MQLFHTIRTSVAQQENGPSYAGNILVVFWTLAHTYRNTWRSHVVSHARRIRHHPWLEIHRWHKLLVSQQRGNLAQQWLTTDPDDLQEKRNIKYLVTICHGKQIQFMSCCPMCATLYSHISDRLIIIRYAWMCSNYREVPELSQTSHAFWCSTVNWLLPCFNILHYQISKMPLHLCKVFSTT